MASRTSSEMSWVDLNIPDAPEGEPDLMSFLPLWPAWVCKIVKILGQTSYPHTFSLQLLLATWISFLKITDWRAPPLLC